MDRYLTSPYLTLPHPISIHKSRHAFLPSADTSSKWKFPAGNDFEPYEPLHDFSILFRPTDINTFYLDEHEEMSFHMLLSPDLGDQNAA